MQRQLNVKQCDALEQSHVQGCKTEDTQSRNRAMPSAPEPEHGSITASRDVSTMRCALQRKCFWG